VEVLGNPTSHKPPEGGDVVVLDPIWLGPHTPCGFLPRLQVMTRHFNTNPNLQTLFRMKTWYDNSEEAFQRCDQWDWEGLVLMAVNAPSPFLNPRFCRTSRYIKRKLTYDVLEERGVVERTLDGAFVRTRPDKREGNNGEALAELKNAIDYDAARSIMRIPYDPEAEKDALSMSVDVLVGVTMYSFPSMAPALLRGVGSILRWAKHRHPDKEVAFYRSAFLDRISPRPEWRSVLPRKFLIDPKFILEPPLGYEIEEDFLDY